MKAGISTASFYPMLTEKSIMLMHEKGVSEIEIFVNTLSEIETEYVKELARIIRDNGQRVAALHPFTCAFDSFLLFTRYERRFNDAIEMHKRYFEAMNILGTSIFVFHGIRKGADMPDEECYERFARLREAGQAFGVRVAQENIVGCKSGSINFLKGLVNYLGKDTELVFDNKQSRLSGYSEKEFIDALGDNIVHIHLSDYVGSENTDVACLPIGSGKLNVAEVVDMLNAFGYNGNLMIELYCERLKSVDDVFTSYHNLLLSL